jgi:hypothetical protein
MLARAGKYNGCLFHRLVPGFMVIICIIFLDTPSLRPSFWSTYRYNQVTQLVQAQGVNHTGARRSVTNTT